LSLGSSHCTLLLGPGPLAVALAPLPLLKTESPAFAGLS
jgi:hypothetical protein